MFSEKQLHWIHANRQRRMRSSLVGKTANKLTQSLQSRLEGRRELVQWLTDNTDGCFRAHCTLGPWSTNKVVILVDDPRWLQPLRVQWLFGILNGVRALPTGRRILGVEFRPGSSEQKFLKSD